MVNANNSIDGENENIQAVPSANSTIIANAVAINSGKGYIDNEFVYAYLTGGLAPITIVNGGSNYTNNDTVIFTGGGVSTQVSAYVTTNTSGGITSVSYSNGSGSGYTSVPNLSVRSNTGVGAVLTTSVVEFNNYSTVTGRVVKSGVGKQEGYWQSTRGFISSDKYIQDSYFYQDYSYQIKVAATLDQYKDILYDTFHVAGNELFGEFYQLIDESSPAKILYEPTQALYQNYLSIDTTTVKIDTTAIEIDQDYTF